MVLSSLYISAGLAILLAIFLQVYSVQPLIVIVIIAYPFLLFGSFMYMMFYPDAMISRRQRDIEAELVFAGRHVLIALRAGMPLFDSLVGVSSGYGAVSEEFRKVIDKINLGVPMGQAVREAGANSPSNEFSRIMMQLSNAISSGADVANSLEVVLTQISKEQAISLKAYGQKLNPLVMFFMIFGIIFPSLGVAFAIILFSLVSGGTIGLSPSSLFYVLAFIALVQFIFLSVMESSRPRYVL
ncbi:Type II secretion system (T2SS), protein F [uncultured archaeon]|nr:Type II secretion system (T2SS), protein F [uncultured archaeon]